MKLIAIYTCVWFVLLYSFIYENIKTTDSHGKYLDIKKEPEVKFETLQSYDNESLLDIEASRLSGADHSMDSHDEGDQAMHTMMITPELMGMMPTTGHHRIGMHLTLMLK